MKNIREKLEKIMVMMVLAMVMALPVTAYGESPVLYFESVLTDQVQQAETARYIYRE